MIPLYEANWEENIVSAFTKRRCDRSRVAFCKLDPGSSTLSSLLLFYALWMFLAPSQCHTAYTHFMIYAPWYTKHTGTHTPNIAFVFPTQLLLLDRQPMHDRGFYASKPR